MRWIPRALLLSLAVLMASVMPCGAGANDRLVVRFSAPAVPQALPFLRVVERDALRSAGVSAAFIPWRSPEQLRAFVANGTVDAVIAALPTAAVLANKGIPCTLLAVYSAPLWVVSTESPAAAPERAAHEAFTLLQGKDILLPFAPGNMPELALNVLAAEQGIRLTTRHCGSAMEAANLLRHGRAAYALLPEPAASLVSAQAEGTRRIRKCFTLNAVWRQVFPDQGAMPTAACLVVGTSAQRPEVCALVRQHFVEGAAWVEGHPEAAFRLALAGYPELGKALGALPDTSNDILHRLGVTTGPAGEQAARFMLERLFALNPASLGGRMPDAAIWGFDDAQR